jgi:hypothetical protein
MMSVRVVLHDIEGGTGRCGVVVVFMVYAGTLCVPRSALFVEMAGR